MGQYRELHQNQNQKSHTQKGSEMLYLWNKRSMLSKGDFQEQDKLDQKEVEQMGLEPTVGAAGHCFTHYATT